MHLKNDSGIKSKILIPIIMAMEKAKQNVINLVYLLSLILKSITKLPIIVDNPAIVATKSGPMKLFKILTLLV